MKNSRSNLMIYAQQLICIGGLRGQSLFYAMKPVRIII